MVAGKLFLPLSLSLVIWNYWNSRWEGGGELKKDRHVAGRHTLLFMSLRGMKRALDPALLKNDFGVQEITPTDLDPRVQLF